MTYYIVRARSDGRAGMPVFGLSTKQAKSFAGQTVHIGDREVMVGRDGRTRLSINFAGEKRT